MRKLIQGMIYFKAYCKFVTWDRKSSLFIFFLFVASLFFFSCGIVEIKVPPPRGIFYGDFDENKRIAPSLFVEFDGIDCDIKKDTPLVYLTTGQQLRDCMAGDRISLLYTWSIGCSNQSCISPELAQSFCNNYEVPLYVLALTYDVKALSQHYSIEKPIFAINTKYYGTELERKYKRLFYSDVINQKTRPPNGLFLLFREGKYIDYFHSIDEFAAYMEFISKFN